MTNSELADKISQEIKSREERLEQLNIEKTNIMDELISLRGTLAIFSKNQQEETEKVEIKQKNSEEEVKRLEAERPCPYKNFADLISTFMIDNSLNCTELANCIQMNPEQVRLWRDNRTVPQKRFREQLTDALVGVSANTVKRCDVIKAFELSDNSERVQMR